jgi:TrwC relaxase
LRRLHAHDTSHALDPHLHCIVFNATFDPVENRWKTLQNYELLRARKFAENAYYHELARELRTFGCQIRNRARGDFQVEGVSDELCERFSKRRAEIDKALARLLVEKPELVAGDVMATRRLLATAERARKQQDLSRAELLTLWESQLTREERQDFSRLRDQSTQSPSDEKRLSLADAMQWAEEHLFDRNSVVLECQLWQDALGRARSETFSLSELTDFTRQRG